MEFKPSQEDFTGNKYDNQDVMEISFPPTAQASFDVNSISRSSILDFRDEGFLLHGVLSPTECQHLINEGDRIGFDKIRVKTEYRNCKRIILDSPKIAEQLWERVKAHVGEIDIEGDPHDHHIHGIATLLKGKWKPCGLNQIFRLCKYNPGGHFAPHFDGHLVVSPEERSMKTLMLYLNGDFSGGCTNFVDESQTLHMDKTGKYCAEEKNIIHQIQPETGMAIIFNHHRLHEGQALRDGVKYILRTDVMYQRYEKAEIDPKEEQALLLVQEADRLEAQGENMKAMELYRKAFKMSETVAEYFGNRS